MAKSDTRATEAQIEAVRAKLREDHRLGKRIRKEYGQGVNWQKQMDEDRAQYGRRPFELRTLYKFADPEDGYTEAELDELCRECQHLRQKRTVGLTAVRHLLTIKDRSKRRKFQSMMIRGGWSDQQTVAELKRHVRPRWKGGRKPRVAEDVGGLLLQIESFVNNWCNWFDWLQEGDNERVKVRLSELDRELQTLVREMDDKIRMVKASLDGSGKEADEESQATGRERRSSVKRLRKRTCPFCKRA